MSSASSSMRAWKSSAFSNTTARPRCTISAGVAALGLMTAPRGARLPRSTAMPALALNGASIGLMTSVLKFSRVGDVLADRPAVRGDRVEVQVRRDLLHHRRQAAGVAEVLHQVLARGLQVDQARQLAGEAVEVVDRRA